MNRLSFATALLCTASLAAGAQDMQQDLNQKIAAAKQSMARNKAALQHYSWTAHTEISLKGEVKNTKDELCRYGPDGKVQKTPLSAPPAQHRMGPMKKKVVENKKEEMSDYMQRAVGRIHDYIPPEADRIEVAKQAGNISLAEAGPDGVKLQIKNYLLEGDSLALTFDKAAKASRMVNINTYLQDPKDAVTLQVDFQTLPDGTNYPATMILDAPAKKLQVRVQNSNYQRLAN